MQEKTIQSPVFHYVVKSTKHMKFIAAHLNRELFKWNHNSILPLDVVEYMWVRFFSILNLFGGKKKRCLSKALDRFGFSVWLSVNVPQSCLVDIF